MVKNCLMGIPIRVLAGKPCDCVCKACCVIDRSFDFMGESHEYIGQ